MRRERERERERKKEGGREESDEKTMNERTKGTKMPLKIVR